ncbi:hypothetical protein M3J09_010529 [Ascochyta lentis]
MNVGVSGRFTGDCVVASGYGKGRWRQKARLEPHSPRLASMTRYSLPPCAVEFGHCNGFTPPQAGALTRACQYTILVPSSEKAGSARPFQLGSFTAPLLLFPAALTCCPKYSPRSPYRSINIGWKKRLAPLFLVLAAAVTAARSISGGTPLRPAIHICLSLPLVSIATNHSSSAENAIGSAYSGWLVRRRTTPVSTCTA